MSLFTATPLTEHILQEMGSVANGISLCLEQKRSAEALDASEVKYRSVIEIIKEVIFQMNEFGHWTFLRILWESDGITQRELSTEAGVMEPTTHVALNAMETMGYILRKRRPENRRNVYVHLTPRGRALKTKLVPLAEDVNAIGVAGLSAADIGTVRQSLIAIIENLARDEALAEPATTAENVARPKRAPRTRAR